MGTPRIAYLPGDGIGPEVLASARTVLESAGLEAEWTEAPVGWSSWIDEGDALPAETLRVLQSTDCCLFGAITSKPATDAEAELSPHLKGTGLRYTSPILRIRQAMGLALNVRPATFWSGVASPLSAPPAASADGRPFALTVFRENTEDLYVGCEAHPVTDGAAVATAFPTYGRFTGQAPDDIAASLRVVTRQATERLLESAFSFAEANGHPTVTLAEKPNVLRATGGLVLEVARDVAARHPSVRLVEQNVDSLCTELVRRPGDFPVIAATNLFGDILSDLAAGLSGGLGLAPSGSYGDTYALFEPVHGSAPDIAGRGIADPLAAVLSGAMMARHLGRDDIADVVERAVAGLLTDGRVLPRDLGGSATTAAVTAALVKRLQTLTV
ncbi:MAG: isocitrate/isopropylmalate dehydrogenase family protein [Euryarchaeota archaeon]|nr:isocitrate/isopropylmalate dehydrogenase family protein [Euryarchaeota archaeon]